MTARRGEGKRLRRAAQAGGRCAVAATALLCGAAGTATGQQAAAQVPAATATATATTTATLQGGMVQGTVVAGEAGKPGGVPLPGVAVTATNTLTGRKYAAATDVDGRYRLQIPRNGRYVIRAELAGFAPVTTEVVLNGTPADLAGRASDLGMQLASRVAAEEARAEASTGAAAGGAGASASLLRGLQNLSLSAGGAAGAEDASGGGGNAGAALPSLGGAADTAEAGNETVAVNGQAGQTNGLANMSEDELRDRIAQGVAQARASGLLPPGVDPTAAIAGILGPMMGVGGGGRGGPGGRHGGFGGGAFRRMDPTQLHGGLNFQGDYSTFDSAQWSPTLTPQPKLPYSKDTFGVTLAGSPQMPGFIKPSTKQFGFLNFNFSRNTTPEVLTAVVPTAAERGGDFSGLLQTINGQTAVTPIYDPVTGQQFSYNGVANAINPARITPQALYILNNFYPLPNVQDVGTRGYNYQTDTTAGQNAASLSMRFIRNLGASASNGPFFGRFGGGRRGSQPLHQSLNFNFSYSHAADDIPEYILPLSGATLTDGYNLAAGYTIGKGRLNETATVTWNRSNALTRNYFTNTADDPATASGIELPSTAELGGEPNFYNGLPSMSINNFSSINNTDPQQNVGQTISFSDQLSWRHGKHNLRFGVDARRVQRNSIGGGNPLGSFTFTGFSTENPCTNGVATVLGTATQCPMGSATTTSTTGQADSGSAFADFLLGLPQQTQIQAGLEKIHLRGTVLDGYANDDYRPRGGLTLNFGLRYEYFGPYSEINNRLVNLTGVSVGTTSVGCVTPVGLAETTAAGTLQCGVGVNSALIHPDRTMFSPRFGVAYQPKFLPAITKSMVVRAGYGVNFNTGQFATFAQQLSYQPPFAITQNNVIASSSSGTAATGCVQQAGAQNSNLTLANGFGCATGELYQNNYAVDPNYRLGYVQIYNVDVQRTLPLQVVLNVGYNGSHGSDQNVVNAPNHTPSAVTTANATAFLYQQSIAESTFNALTINAQKRLQKGIELRVKYQWAHSIDDASSINGTTETSSVQNPGDLHAERSNSSFDVRQQLTGSWMYELPVGPNRRFLNRGGVASKLLDGFSLSGTYTLQSGGYYTPSYQATASQVSAGGTYTLRPDLVAGTPIRGLGQVHSFFNTAAFAAPGLDAYGTASRYSIQGPGVVLVSSSLSRTVPLGETRSFEARVTANNVFNTVQYNGINTSLTSATFGQVTGAQTMRQLLFVGKFRF